MEETHKKKIENEMTEHMDEMESILQQNLSSIKALQDKHQQEIIDLQK